MRTDAAVQEVVIRKVTVQVGLRTLLRRNLESKLFTILVVWSIMKMIVGFVNARHLRMRWTNTKE